MHHLRGQLLISGGRLFDSNFRHTVVLVGAHGPEGAVGVVLNRPLQHRVADAAPPLALLTGPDASLFEGGPVEANQAVLLVESADAGLLDVPVFGGIGFLTGDVSADVRSAVRRARVFLGHAGWGPGQLEAELAEESWILEPARPDDVFSATPLTLWHRILKRKGPPFDLLARLPFDPSSN